MAKSAEYLAKALERKKRFQKQAIQNSKFKARRHNNYHQKDYRQNDWRNQKKIENNNQNTLRSRGFFKVLPTDDVDAIPQCSHGPCLLFEKNSGTGDLETFFACAIYRNKDELCDFKLKYDRSSGEVEKLPEDEEGQANKTKKKKKTIFGYNSIPKTIAALQPDDTLLYCETCINVYINKHQCVCAPIDPEGLKFPTRMLPPLDEQNGESQFFFSEESQNVVLSMIQKAEIDGVLCIGAPRIFETVRANLPEKQVFMLDYDRRFAKFFPSRQYAQYSMLVDHFYDKNAEGKLVEFMKNSKKLLLVVDPPFGVFMEPLLQSIQKMKQRFTDAGNVPTSFFSLIVLPSFLRKHVLHDGFWMSDYRVTYENHKIYANPMKTIVRFFTNLPNFAIDLEGIEGYKFCEACDRWVTEKNEHCKLCNNCTSIDQGNYYHCHECSKCVKPTYQHCTHCQRCHLVGRCIV